MQAPEAPKDAPPPEAKAVPKLAVYVGIAIVEWFRRYGRRDAAGDPIGDTTAALEALADTAGELIGRLPAREMRRKARAGFEARFRRAHAAVGKAGEGPAG
jgi:hypothetical protein